VSRLGEPAYHRRSPVFRKKERRRVEANINATSGNKRGVRVGRFQPRERLCGGFSAMWLQFTNAVIRFGGATAYADDGETLA
jgi:hypothetical protein